MWIFTTFGFFSIVAHREKPEHLLVRARQRTDLFNLLQKLPQGYKKPEPFEDPYADYRWRAVVERPAVAFLLSRICDQMAYDNFKNAVAESQGLDRAKLYSAVWSTVRHLQDDANE